MFGREVEFQAAQDAVGFWRRKGFIERARRMGREIVQNDPHDVGLRVMEIDKIAPARGKVLRGALFGTLTLRQG